MSAKRKFLFMSEEEAKAFIQGVQYVNDSAIEIHGIVKIKDKYRVRITDHDKKVNDE